MDNKAAAPDLMREQFEAAVIARMKESGYLEVEIRVECLQRDSSGGYIDGSVDAWWHFWQASRATMVVELERGSVACDYIDTVEVVSVASAIAAIEAAGGAVKQ